MTTTAPPLTGQDINLAARATRQLLVADLERLDATFDQWVVINLIGTGQVSQLTALRARLVAGLGLDDATIDDVLTSLVATDLIHRDGEALSLTATGAQRWQTGQVLVAEIVGALYGGIDPDELATTRRVLIEVTERAERRLGRQP